MFLCFFAGGVTSNGSGEGRKLGGGEAGGGEAGGGDDSGRIGRSSGGGDWITTTRGGKGPSWMATGLVEGSGTGSRAPGGDGLFQKSSPTVPE